MAAARASAIGVLTTRIGRRFVALFLGCAFLPLMAFAWLTLSKVTQHMNVELCESLHNGAKTAGMGVAAKLAQVTADVTRLAESLHQRASERMAAPRPVTDGEVPRCADLWIVADGGDVVLRGEPVARLPEPTAAERRHLAAGKPLLRVVGAPPRLVLVVALDRTDPRSPLLVGSLRDGRFWEAQELRSPGAEFAILDDAGALLCHSFQRLPELAGLAAAIRRSPASGTIEWRADDEPHVARYWRAFLSPQYDLDLLVVHSKSRQAAFEVADAFVRWFVLTALGTLLCVFVASLVQLRRTLGPIVTLSDATRRVARGDLDVRVLIRSRDEFGELGQAFNHMTAQIQENVRRREQTERELVASRDRALDAARAKAEFVTNVSHEFRTPMTEILGAAEILVHADDADVATRREFAAIAASGAKRLARLVDDVLELGSTTELRRECVDVAASLREAIGRMPATVAARVRTDIADGIPPVTGDPERLRDAWCRLIDNAAKFSPPVAPIEVRARCCGEVVVEIVDQGVGISRLDLSRIFEPFRQVGRDQMTEKAHGAGLGLTLAKATIERHAGRIEVDSELGNGATFRVLLPAAKDVPIAV